MIRLLGVLPFLNAAALRKAHRVENPTEADLNALADATERALDSMGKLEPWE